MRGAWGGEKVRREAAPSARARRRLSRSGRRARGRPRRSPAGRSPAVGGASLALAARRLGAGRVRRRRLGAPAREPLRPLLVAAGGAWFAGRAQQPGRRLGALFTVGLLGYAACPALVAHAALAYPGGRVAGRLERAGLALAYASTILALGLLPALVFDPAAQGCTQCPQQPAGRRRAPPVRRGGRAAPGLVLGLVWAPALAAAGDRARSPARSPPRGGCARRCCCRPSPTSRSSPPATRTASTRGFLSNDARRPRPVARAGGGARRCSCSASRGRGCAGGGRARASRGSSSSWATRPRRAGSATRSPARSATRRSSSPTRSTATARRRARAAPVALAEARRERSRRSCAAAGRSRVIVHRAELLDDPGLLEEVARGRPARARARAAAGARRARSSSELRASRARIVEAGDAERRRLERDLHDGAQQRLVVLSFALRLLRAARRAGGRALDAAERELRGALAELRELAHGIYPAVLADEGLAAALEALAEARPRADARSAPLPDERFRARGRGRRLLPRRRGVATRATGRASRVRAPARRRRACVVEIDGAGGARRRPASSSRTAIGALDGELDRRTPATHRARGDPVRVVIADDEMLLREGLARLLADAGFEVVGKAADGPELLRAVAADRPDVAIVDIRMPPTHTDEGLVAAQEIRAAHPARRRARALALPRVALRDAAARGAPRAASATCSRSACPTSPCSSTRCAGSPRASACSTRRSSRGSCAAPREREPARRAHRPRARGARR